MRTIRNACTILMLAGALHAAAPERWDVQINTPGLHNIEIFRGESLAIRPRFLSYSQPWQIATGATVRLYWTTNNWTTTWATNGSLVAGDTGRVEVVWTPSNDVGAVQYQYFIGVQDTSLLYRARGYINMRASPGFTPSAAPLPVWDGWTNNYIYATRAELLTISNALSADAIARALATAASSTAATHTAQIAVIGPLATNALTAAQAGCATGATALAAAQAANSTGATHTAQIAVIGPLATNALTAAQAGCATGATALAAAQAANSTGATHTAQIAVIGPLATNALTTAQAGCATGATALAGAQAANSTGATHTAQIAVIGPLATNALTAAQAGCATSATALAAAQAANSTGATHTAQIAVIGPLATNALTAAQAGCATGATALAAAQAANSTGATHTAQIAALGVLASNSLATTGNASRAYALADTNMLILVVSGAGTTAANGVYTWAYQPFSGWHKGDGYAVNWVTGEDGSRTYYLTYNFGLPLYGREGGMGTVPAGGPWNQLFGDSPAPAVSFGPSTTTIAELVTNLFNVQLSQAGHAEQINALSGSVSVAQSTATAAADTGAMHTAQIAALPSYGGVTSTVLEVGAAQGWSTNVAWTWQGAQVVPAPTNLYEITYTPPAVWSNNQYELLPYSTTNYGASATGTVTITMRSNVYLASISGTWNYTRPGGTTPQMPVSVMSSYESATTAVLSAYCSQNPGDAYAYYYAYFSNLVVYSYDRVGMQHQQFTNDAAGVVARVDPLPEGNTDTRRVVNQESLSAAIAAATPGIAKEAWNYTPSGNRQPSAQTCTIDKPLVQQGQMAYLQSGDYYAASYQGGDWYSVTTGSVWRLGPGGRVAFEVTTTNRMLFVQAFTVRTNWATIDVATNWVTGTPYVEFCADLGNPQWLAAPSQIVTSNSTYWRIQCPATASQRFYRAVSPGGANAINSYYRHTFADSWRLTDTAWDDLRVTSALRPVGANQPTLDVFEGGVRLWTFATSAEMFFTAQLPHGYKAGTTIRPHVHWTHKQGSPSGDVAWMLEYTTAPYGSGSYGAPVTIGATTTVASVSQYGQGIISLPAISGSGLAESSCIVGRLYRGANAGSDVMLVEMDFHHEIEKPGSDNEIP